MTKQERVEKLLKPLFDECDGKMVPASEELIAKFRQQATARNVPDTVIEELTEFYKVSNGVVPCLNGFGINACDDEILYEWWNEYNVLWLGDCNDEVLRWSNGKYCLGDASNDSYGDEYEFSTLVELKECTFEECKILEY